jgi:hypothetical protein
VPPRDRVVAVPIDRASQSFQDALKGRGWDCVVAKDGKNIQIKSVIKTRMPAGPPREGGNFTLVLADKRTAGGHETSVRVDGDQKANPEVLEMVAAVQSAARKPKT